MLGMMGLAIVFAAFDLCASGSPAATAQNAPQSDKKYNLSVCALFKNEARYLKEWIEYHRMIGVDHFYLYNNGSRDRSVDILIPYVKQGLVTLKNWPDLIPEGRECCPGEWALSTQVQAYENAAKYTALGETEWLAFIDVDEYLVPVHTNTFAEILEKYKASPGLKLNSDCFDAATIDALPKRELLIATAELVAEPPKPVTKSIEKIIFKPESHTTFVWPPFQCNFKDDQQPARLGRDELRINKYVNRFNGTLNFGKVKEKLHIDSRMLTDNEKAELLEIGFKIEDGEKLISRFESELRKRMGLETGWSW